MGRRPVSEAAAGRWAVARLSPRPPGAQPGPADIEAQIAAARAEQDDIEAQRAAERAQAGPTTPPPGGSGGGMSWAMDPLDGEPVHIPGSHASDQTCSEVGGVLVHPPAGPPLGRHMASIGDDQVVAAWPTTTSPPWPTSAGGPVTYPGHSPPSTTRSLPTSATG